MSRYPRDELEESVLLIVNGAARSGTIWATRLLADSLQVASRTSYANPPCTNPEADSAVWHMERPGKFIRRLHYHAHEYPYSPAIPLVSTIRDPRDIVVSQADYYGRNSADTQAQIWIPRLFAFFREWAESGKITATMRYEKLLKDAKREVICVLDELNFPIDEKQIDQAVRDHEFSRSTNYQKGKYGHEGSWKTRIDPSLAGRIWKRYRDDFYDLGYDQNGFIE